MSSLLPRDKSSYRFIEGGGDTIYRRRWRTRPENDDPNAYEIETDQYVVWILTDEEESRFCWGLVYTEGDYNNINNNYWDDTFTSWTDFATFEECVDDINKAISGQDDNFFRSSRYDWHTVRESNGDVEGTLYMRDRQGARLGLQVLRLHDHASCYPCSLWNYDKHKCYNDWDGDSQPVIDSLMDKYLEDWFYPVARDIRAVDDFVDALQSAAGITISKRY